MKEWLLEGFDYERWALRKWFDVLAEPLEPAMRHLLNAQAIWITRFCDDAPAADAAPTRERMEELIQRWEREVRERDLDELFHYKNLRGEPQARTCGEIARHVLNHGTYHRGQMRQIAADNGIEFPDTDYIYYVMAKDAGRL